MNILKIVLKECWDSATWNYLPFRDWPAKSCYICGYSTEKTQDWIKLIPSWNKELERVQYLCEDHGSQVKTVWDCYAGEEITLKTFPEFLRKPRNTLVHYLSQAIIYLKFYHNLGAMLVYFLRYRQRAIKTYNFLYGRKS